MNSQGYGDSQGSTPASLNSHAVPLAPTSVYIGVTSDTMLTVLFHEPISDNGDTVISYKVDWNRSQYLDSTYQSPDKGTVYVFSGNSYTLARSLERPKGACVKGSLTWRMA
jgi:hypothetical protein